MSNRTWFAQVQWARWEATRAATFNPRTTHCLRCGKPASACQCEPLPPALDLPDLTNDDWPAIDYSDAYDDDEAKHADSNDGNLLLPFEE